MNNKSPKISVVLPFYNCCEELAGLFTMLETQTFKEFELIACNDGSTDHSLSVCKTLAANSSFVCCILSLSENRGVAEARNTCLQASMGSVVCFLDHDDFWFDNKLDVVWNIHENKSGLLSCHLELFEIEGSRRLLSHVKEGFTHFKEDLQSGLLNFNFLSTSAVSIDGDVARKFQFDKGYIPCEDYDYWLKVSNSVKIVLINNVLGLYRMGGNSLSSNLDVVKTQHRKVVIKYLGIAFLRLKPIAVIYLIRNLINSFKNQYFEI